MDNKYQAQMLQDHVLRIQSNDIFKDQDTHLAEAKRHLQQVWLMLDAYRKKPPRRVIVVEGGTVIGRGVVAHTRGELAYIDLDDGGNIEVDVNQVDLIEVGG